PDQMDQTRLNDRVGEHCIRRIREPFEPIAHNKKRVLNASDLQLCKNTHPVLCGLSSPVGTGPDAGHVALSFEIYTDGSVERTVSDLTIPDFDVDRIDENRCVYGKQRAGSPLIHLIDYPIGDHTDPVLRKRRTVRSEER